MIISQVTLAIFFSYVGSIPMFNNLNRLEVSFSTCFLQMLPDFLGSFPNLKHLTLCVVYLNNVNVEKSESSIVPRCLLSTLECVEIRELITGDETRIKENILKRKKETLMNAARYILENSLVLKKLILVLSPVTNQISDTTKELLTFRKGSHGCNIYMGLLHSDDKPFLQLIG
ncbi:unnamed protein product [Eruca vesicaria subsp. sativa]|uniref:FBD domain-containing protein n=1 Tax=Eruca vesicaria subsp. sativa TaxID=29727 RepID=A0ABC8IRU0_ERUVS|nr:unnamed protein product [Eruca vesicaria subsp. sativa]